jgi:phosphatidylglycerophosphate synthase
MGKPGLLSFIGSANGESQDTMHTQEEIQNHDRVNKSFIPEIEKKILNRIAAQSPSWATPDLMTASGFVGALFTAFGYILSGLNRNFLWLACFGWFLNWFGDAMDGTIARYRKIERQKYGFYIDHTIDALGSLCIGIGFALSPYVRFDIGILVILGYFLLNIQVYVLMCATNIFNLSYGRFSATDFKIFAFFFTMVLYFAGIPGISFRGYELSLWDILSLCVVCLLILTFIITTLRNALRLAKSEKIDHMNQKEDHHL